MADYRADKISGWQRAYSVQINNPLNETPNIIFAEEVVVVNDGLQTKLPSQTSGLSADMTDPSKTITLLNPFDDTVIGEGSYGQIQVLLYSLYKQLAAERDAI